MKIEEVKCKSALTGKTGHFTLNPYTGCSHRCSYCYAVYIMKWQDSPAKWGTWLKVKTNIAEVLKAELKKKKSAHIFMSTVCDVYQPVEEKYRLTRECLVELLAFSKTTEDFSLYIITKSPLILRDIDILKQFEPGKVKAGFSINSYSDKIGELFEPGAPKPAERIKAAIALKREGINTGMFISPVLPYITSYHIKNLFNVVEKNKFDFVSFDTLNYLKGTIGIKMRKIYSAFGVKAVKELEKAFYNNTYMDEVKIEFNRLAGERKFKISIF